MKPYLLALFFLLFVIAAQAQQNAPVAGQASILADLLKKDYSAIDPDLRSAEIVKDRATVISIFKSFLKEYAMTDYKKDGQDIARVILDTAISKAEKSYAKYNKAKQTASQLSTVTTSTAPAVDAVNAANKRNNNATDRLRNAYYTDQQNADDAQFDALHYFYVEKDKNKFIGDMIDLFKAKYTALFKHEMDLTAIANANSAVQKALPFLGGSLDVSSTAIIDGISKFLAKRIKQELMTFAIQNIQHWLTTHDKTVPIEELLVLLPKTASYLAKFDADKLTSFPTELKQFIQNDLDHLVDNAYNLKNTTYFKGKIANQPDLELAFDAIPLIGKINQVKYSGDYFNILSSSQLVADLKKRADIPALNIATFIDLMEMMSNSLTITTNGEPSYTTVDFWKTYGKEVKFMKLYFGFLYQQDIKYYEIAFKRSGDTDITVEKLLLDLMDNETNAEKMFKAAAPVLTNICKTSESIYQQAQTIKKLNNAGQAVGADTVYNFAKSIIDFSADLGKDADQLLVLFSNSANPSLDIAKKMEPFLLVANTCNDAVRDVRNKKYADGILELITLGAKLDPGKLSQVAEFVNLYSMSGMNNTHWADWQAIGTLETNFGNIPGPLAVTAVRVSTELTAIKAFYIQQTLSRDAEVENTLSDASVAFGGLAAGGHLDSALIPKLTKLLHNDKIIRVVVSYYAGFLFERVTAELAPKMVDLQVNNRHVFTPAQVDQLVAAVNKYLPLVFTNKIMGTTADPTDIHAQEAYIYGFIKTYLDSAPSVFGWAVDPKAVSIVNFVNDMAQAKNSDDVEKAIEAFALPAGSYAIKQKSDFTVALNAYPGLLPAWEIGGGQGISNSFSTGFTAPVGLSVSFGHVLGSTDLGLFIPVIDLGAVTQIRLGDNSNTTALPQLSWSNFISPGLFVTYGIRNSPFSLNAGVQYGPNIQNNLQSSGASTYRVGLGLTIDIPIFNFYVKPVAGK